MAIHQKSSQITMINPLYLIGLVFWSLYLLPTSSIACSCAYSHPQEHFCSSDFVVSVSIQGDPKHLLNHPADQLGYLRYPVKLNKVFKGNGKTAIRKGFIYTGSPLNSCTPELNKNITYLITGRFQHGKPFITSCNFIAEWSTLTARQKKGFRRNFGRACGCKVIDTGAYPFYEHHDELESDNGFNLETNRRRSGHCHWETKWEIEFDCQATYSVCTPVTQPTVDNTESNDVANLFNHDNNINNVNRSSQRSKWSQKCKWEQNRDYRYCMKLKADRKDSSQIERENGP